MKSQIMLFKLKMGSDIRKCLVLFGVILINCPYGVTLYYGNMISYVYSLRYILTDSRSYDLDVVWVYGIYAIFLNMGTLIGDLLQRSIGLRNTAAFGIFMFTAGITLTYFTVQHSVWAMTLTFGVVGGMGNGTILAITLLYIAGWFDRRVGIASASSSAAAGIGGNVMNQIITAYINPGNLSPNDARGRMTFFTQTQIIDRVALSFVLVGGVIAVSQVIGFCFLKSPPKQENYGRGNELSTNASEAHISNQNSSSTFQAELDNYQSENHPLHRKEHDFTPKELLKLERFYTVSFSVFVLAFCQIVGATYYKLFGQIWIADDKFLAVIGSSSSIVIIFSRLSCGYLTDKIGAKNTILLHVAACSTLLSLWYFTARVSHWWFFVWTNLLFAVTNNMYALYPVVVVKLFGRTYCATNLFLVNLAMMLAMFVSPPLMIVLLQKLGWFGLFCTGGCLSFLSLLATIFRM